jgi:hypothetical protein
MSSDELFGVSAGNLRLIKDNQVSDGKLHTCPLSVGLSGLAVGLVVVLTAKR